MALVKSVAIKSPRKLIEVALPLDKINAALRGRNLSVMVIQVPCTYGGHGDP
jgi:hypothetical protein